MVSPESERSHIFKKVPAAVLLQDATKAFQIGPAQSSQQPGLKTLTGAVEELGKNHFYIEIRIKSAVVQDQFSMVEEGGVLLLISMDEAVSLCTGNDMSILEETWTSVCSSQHGDVIPGLPAQALSLSCLMVVTASMRTEASPTGGILLLKQSAAQNPPRLWGAEFHVPGST